ncbi:uncharacterized protein LOC116295333 [Actinia tenebrosa]|uniref:Uncharacterized protein LOC116295333 n=1 Tax=Actinia tenebrosa TaxID=6105 RepID=A0A6P8I257_ACTTE|nr:uncharacterized protein LOC116295333 [Actinia tenebrosa]
MLSVKGGKKILSAEFMSLTYSRYSGESSTLIVPNWRSTIDFRSEEYLDEDREAYSPLADRFILSGVDINDTVYLQRSITYDESAFLFPAAGKVSNEAAILHGPEVINGHEHDSGILFLGVVISVHNKIGLSYQWFFNGQPLCSGPHRCLIKVTEPGSYFCKVFYKEIMLQSATVTVTAFPESQSVYQKLQGDTSSTSDKKSSYPLSVSVANLLKTGELRL